MEEIDDRSQSSLEVVALRLGHSLLAGTLSSSGRTITIDFYGASHVDQKNAYDALEEIAERGGSIPSEGERLSGRPKAL